MPGVWWCLPLDHLLVRLPIVVLELLVELMAGVLNMFIMSVPGSTRLSAERGCAGRLPLHAAHAAHRAAAHPPP